MNEQKPVQSAIHDKLNPEERTELEQRYKFLAEKCMALNKKKTLLEKEATLIDFRLRKS